MVLSRNGVLYSNSSPFILSSTGTLLLLKLLELFLTSSDVSPLLVGCLHCLRMVLMLQFH